MAENLKSKSVQVLDSRASNVFSNGHYPGAINIPFKDKLLNADKTSMKSVEELQQGDITQSIPISSSVILLSVLVMSVKVVLSNYFCYFVVSLVVVGIND